MTLPNQASYVVYTGNGATTNFPFDFEIPTGADLVSIFDIATGALTPLDPADYTINGLDDPDGGSVDYAPAITSAKRITIERKLDLTQDLDLTTQSAYNPEDLEGQLDRIVMMLQQLQGDSDRSIKVTLGSTLTPDEFIEDLQAAEAAAEASAEAAADSAAAAAASAAMIDLPAAPNALDYIRRNAGNTAYENRTPAQARADLSAFGVVRVQKFTASGTYTPHAAMKYAVIEAWGGGGGGGGVAGAGGEIRSASGGGAGGYSRKIVSAATVGAGSTITIGAGGAGGAAGANDGAAGGDTSADALCIAKGGSGGLGNGSTTGKLGGAGGVVGTGDLSTPGENGKQGLCATIITLNFSTSDGGNTSVGQGGRPRLIDDTNTQTAATGFGAGGAGAAIRNNAVNIAGGAGAPGLVIITEFCSE